MTKKNKEKGKKRIVWRKPNSFFQIKKLKPTTKHGRGLTMIWGYIFLTKLVKWRSLKAV